jgi:NifU-like protein
VRSLPKLIFDHFRHPQNQGRLAPADALGRIEGCLEDSWIVLTLRHGEGGLESGYELVGDRSAVAGLSLLTSWLAGRSWEDAEAVTQDGLAAELGIEHEFLPLLTKPFDALAAALAHRRGEPNPFANDGELVCTCLNVRQGRLEAVIRERRLRTVAEVRHWTRACTGCRSCRDDVEALLAKDVPRD